MKTLLTPFLLFLSHPNHNRPPTSTFSISTSLYTTILRDDQGHVNRQIAQELWDWETRRREEHSLEPLKYSMRSGLKLVEEYAQDSDDIQEGLTVLLSVLEDYNSNSEDYYIEFEDYAREKIKQALQPKLLEKARQMKLAYRRAKGKDPTLAQLAQLLQTTPDRVADLVLHPLSVESTVAVLDEVPHFEDVEEFEVNRRTLLDNGKRLNHNVLVEEFLDPQQELQGDDEAYMHSQVAGPLSDIVPDDEQEEDIDFDMERPDLSNLLLTTLDRREQEIIRLAFGLDDGRPLNVIQIAKRLGISRERVQSTLTESLLKLRMNYFDDDENHYGIDSV